MTIKKKKILQIKNAFLFFLLIFLNSCEDLFLRFKYQTIECESNLFNLDKISIKDDSVGAYADVQFENYYYKIKISNNDKEMISLKNEELDLNIDIFKNREKVQIFFKNTIKTINCSKKTFKM